MAKFDKNLILLAAIVLLLIYPIKYMINFLSFPYPLEYRDVGYIATALDFSNRVNPYSLQNFPAHISVYGVLFPLLIAPFINLVTHPILIARWITTLFLILFLGISFLMLRKRNTTVVTSLVGLLILFNSSCLILKVNGIRPDIPGLFFAFLGVTLMVDGKYDLARIFLSAVSCVLSFYFKQYMIFSAVLIGIYLFIFVSKQKAIIFITIFFTIGLASFLSATAVFPLFYEYFLLHFTHVAAASTRTDFMLQETVSFISKYWIICSLYLMFIVLALRLFLTRQLREVRFNFFDMKSPFVLGVSADIFSAGVIVTLTILTFVLGKNDGNTYTYYGELLLPFLIFVVLPKIEVFFKIISINSFPWL